MGIQERKRGGGSKHPPPRRKFQAGEKCSGGGEASTPPQEKLKLTDVGLQETRILQHHTYEQPPGQGQLLQKTELF